MPRKKKTDETTETTETPKRRRGRPPKADTGTPEEKPKQAAKRRGRPPKATKRDSPGRPPIYGENEVPRGCRYCGSLQTKCYGDAERGAAPRVRLIRYRECKAPGCGRRYISSEEIGESRENKSAGQ